jgi:hypothetical protein
VETAYCEVDVPERLLCDESLLVRVDISDIQDFRDARLTWKGPGPEPFIEIIEEDECPVKDSVWDCEFEAVGCSDSELEEWTLSVELRDGSTATCSTTFTLYD